MRKGCIKKEINSAHVTLNINPQISITLTKNLNKKLIVKVEMNKKIKERPSHLNN